MPIANIDSNVVEPDDFPHGERPDSVSDDSSTATDEDVDEAVPEPLSTTIQESEGNNLSRIKGGPDLIHNSTNGLDDFRSGQETPSRKLVSSKKGIKNRIANFEQ